MQGPFDMDAVRAHCMSAWGVAPQPDWAAVTYGGTALRAASNIVFSNGTVNAAGGQLDEH